MSVKLYDPAKVIITWSGLPITGFADGTFIEVERAEDAFALTMGAGGESARTRSTNRSGTIKITLLQSSSSNDILSAAAFLDQEAGLGVHPFLAKDLFGSTLVEAPNAWVKKLPTMSYGKELGSREWTLECDGLEMLVGGQS